MRCSVEHKFRSTTPQSIATKAELCRRAEIFRRGNTARVHWRKPRWFNLHDVRKSLFVTLHRYIVDAFIQLPHRDATYRLSLFGYVNSRCHCWDWPCFRRRKIYLYTDFRREYRWSNVISFVALARAHFERPVRRSTICKSIRRNWKNFPRNVKLFPPTFVQN